MRILVCPQEFKGSLTAQEAAAAIAAGFARVLPDADLDICPVADGGPGTVAAVLSAAPGKPMATTVQDPLGRPITATWGLLDEGPSAVIEMAAASGLSLLREDELNPEHASTYGTGQLIRAALDAGYRRLIVGVGGSATNDGGAGMAQALGARLLDDRGRDLPPGGAALSGLSRIDVSGLNRQIAESETLVATDVTNLLCGRQGASALYGPQKGATSEMVARLDAALTRYATIIRRDLGVDVAELPGAGAAGGLAAGLVAFLHAQIVPGAELVAKAIGLEERISKADVVVTGEGRLDQQTSFGKSVATVARLARQAGRPVIALVGGVSDGYQAATDGLDAVLALTPRPMSIMEAQAAAASLLTAAAEQAARLIAIGRRTIQGKRTQ